MHTYTKQQLTSMNSSYTWRNTIFIPNDVQSKSSLYSIYPTGYADLNGRKYVALPADTQLTHHIKEKYNII